MNKGFNVVVKRGFLEMIGDGNEFGSIQLDVFIEVKAVDELKAKLRNDAIQSIG